MTDLGQNRDGTTTLIDSITCDSGLRTPAALDPGIRSLGERSPQQIAAVSFDGTCL